VNKKRPPSAGRKRPAGAPKGAASRPGQRRPAGRRPRVAPPKKRAFPLLRRSLYWATVCGLWLILGFTGMAAYYAVGLPDPGQLKLPARAPSITILDVHGNELARRGAYRGKEVSISAMPPHLIQAVVATEDRRFYSHFGVDPFGLSRAMLANLTAGQIVQGGSTISQQLAKNLFLKPKRTLRRKMRELLLALWLETKFSKDRILEIYLNRVYLGAGTYGVDAAARRYFNKPVRRITLREAAMLAGLLKAPSRYAPTNNPKLAAKRTALVLQNMENEGYISAAERRAAIKGGDIAVSHRVKHRAGYALDWVAERVPDYIGEPGRDLIVRTTLDMKLQSMAKQAVAKIMAAEPESAHVSEAALIAMNRSGAVKALIGGRDYARSQFNRAVTAKRQPGSAFKPFVYLAALESGLSPRTIRSDRPMMFKGWMPRNYSGDYKGRMSLKHALSRSVNTVAAGLANEVGVKKVIRAARRLGISSPLHANPSIALGTSEVSLIELTGAYTPFMNGGFGVIPHVVSSIQDSDGQVLYQRVGSGPGRVIHPARVADMNRMLVEVIRRGTGRRAALDRPAAGKTGTSQGFRDALFVGYTARLTTGVWVGNDNGAPMNKVTGGGLPARIWRQFMLAAHKGLPPRPLPGLQPAPDPIGDLVADGSRPRTARKDWSGRARKVREAEYKIDSGFLKRLFSR